MMRRTVFALGLLLGLASTTLAADKLKVLIVDGQNNHNWKATTPVLEKILDNTGQFTVDVATSPPKNQDLSGFRPKFADYDVVLSNYNGALWSKEAQQDLVDYVQGGGGLVIVHAANNAFSGWKQYNEMIGLGWRGAGFGDRLTFNDEAKLVRTSKGEGLGAGHGPQHAFPIVVRDGEHPITKGLPTTWMHAKDELYHGQRGPAANMQILATAYSAADKRGTSAHEPMIWVIPFGKGRVFTTVMGHSPEAMTCVGFGEVLKRGTEWAATGKVTESKLPKDFPTNDEVRTRKLN